MASTADYLNKLIEQKKDIANNLTKKGIEATENETLETLVPKILNINSNKKYYIYNNGQEFNNNSISVYHKNSSDGKLDNWIYIQYYYAGVMTTNKIIFNGYKRIGIAILLDRSNQVTSFYTKISIRDSNSVILDGNDYLPTGNIISETKIIDNTVNNAGGIYYIDIPTDIDSGYIILNCVNIDSYILSIWLEDLDVNYNKNYVSENLINLWEWNGNTYNNITREFFISNGNSPVFIQDDILNREVGYFNNNSLIYGSTHASIAGENFTLQCLFNFPSSDSRNGPFFAVQGKESTALESIGIGCFSTDNHGISVIQNQNPQCTNFNYLVSTQQYFFDNKWHQISVTFNSQNVENKTIITIYIDGEQISMEICDKISIYHADQTSFAMHFGMFPGGHLVLNDTYLCNFAIWDRALSSYEIMQNWQYDKQRYGI